MTSEKELIDDAFYVEKQRWGTWVSENLAGVSLVTSMTKEFCIDATRFYLKGLQEGFSAPESVHDGIVSGKL